MLLSVVLHPDVIGFLRTHPESSLKKSVWQCLEKLKKRQFDGGLRVKKLKGIAKGVWEARINQASRLTYTYEKSRQPATGDKQVYLAVQDICLDHDDVSRCAKARKRTPDAQWLDADEVEIIGNLEVNRQSLPLTEQIALKEAEAEAEDLQISDDVIDELLGNIQWRIVESEEEWEQAIMDKDADLPLKLTPEEYNLVSCYGDLLLSGNAGTGKTTVGLYRLLKSLETLPAGKRLYVAYNPILVKETHRQFQRLVGDQVAEIESVFQFKTIRELCLEILLKAEKFYPPYDEVDYQVFSQLYLAPERKQYPAALVWDEIRSLIKGSQLNVAQKLLLEKDYKQLGKKKASVIPYNKREVVYKLAAWYQRRLEEEKRFDEIDLARETLQLIQQGQGERYQLIVCDEVQDFTELQLELLMQLVTPKGSLFFAGDLNQMISPSGFRWKDLKTRFFKKQRQPLLKSLDYNFRSVRALVNLANQVLSLRTRLLNESMTQTEQPASSYGESARLIAAPLETLQPTLKVLNPEDAILVRTEAEKEQFSGDFQSSFVFTIEEAKGLEFDTVFLVEFFQPSQSLWDKVLSGQQALKDTEIPELRLELNLLYVAVTRARRILNIWETQRSKIWNQPELIGLVQNLEPQLVTEARIEPTSQMWRERGLYYLEAGFYRQSAECFEKAGDTKLYLGAMAKLLLRERKHSEAAEVFVQLESWEQAAQQFELAKQWQKAADCWRKIENIEQQQVCDIYALEDAKQWEDAALMWEGLEKFEEAKRCWLKSNNQPKKNEIEAVEFENKEQWKQAAQHYDLAGMKEKADKCRANIRLRVSPTEVKGKQQEHISHSVTTNITLENLLQMSVEETFRWMSQTLSERHTSNSYFYDVNRWYYSRAVNRFIQAIEHKRQGDFDAALRIYSELFQEMPTYGQLYSSVYKTLASAGEIALAAKAIKLSALLQSLTYALSPESLVISDRSAIREILQETDPYTVLAFWGFQDFNLLMHLGGVKMLQEKNITEQAAKGYLNSIKGRGSVTGCPSDEALQKKGRNVLKHLPWGAVVDNNAPNLFITEVVEAINHKLGSA